MASFSVFFLAVAPMALTSAGQRVSSEIQGTVRDPSDAVVAKASVTATNLDTGLVRSTVTDDNGIYHVDGLAAGNYELKIEHSGFKSKNLNGITLQVNQSVVLNASRNSALDAANFFDKPGEKPSLERDQFGVAAGGPIAALIEAGGVLRCGVRRQRPLPGARQATWSKHRVQRRERAEAFAQGHFAMPIPSGARGAAQRAEVQRGKAICRGAGGCGRTSAVGGARRRGGF